VRSSTYLVRLTDSLIGPLFLQHTLAAPRAPCSGRGAARFGSYLVYAGAGLVDVPVMRFALATVDAELATTGDALRP
jgi:hypothetical protein